MSLRARLTLGYGALLALVLGVSVSFVYAVHSDTHYSDVDAQLGRASADLAENIAAEGPLPVPTMQLTIDTHLSGFGALILDTVSGTVLATTGRDRGASFASAVRDLPPGYGSLQLSREHLRALVAPRGDGRRLVVAASLRGLDATMERLREQILAISLTGLLLAVGLAVAVAVRALRPVDLVSETALSIASTRTFDRRVPPLKQNDELGRLTRAFNLMLDALEEAHAQQRRFVSDVSHELRTPLTAIQGGAELVLATDTHPAEREEAMRHVHEESARLSRLVDDLLSLARADEGSGPQRITGVELDALLMDLFAELRPRAGERMSVSSIDPVVVMGDPDRLKQLLLIVLDNALRYTPGPGRIRVTLQRDTTAAVLTVEDDGIGISAEAAEHAFERFYRGEGARRLDPSGSGLGLPIARWIVSQHGGSITLSPRSPRGTSVVIQLPLPA